jgi:hypothetical protein
MRVRSRRQDRRDQRLAVCEIVEVVASGRGSVVAIPQVRYEVVEDGVLVRRREGKLVDSRRNEWRFGVPFGPEFATEVEHRW